MYQQPPYPLPVYPFYPADISCASYANTAYPFQQPPQQYQQHYPPIHQYPQHAQQQQHLPLSTNSSVIDRATSFALKERPKAKTGPCELLISGQPQAACMEARQTVFKGQVDIYLADTAGQAIKSESLATFLLGGQGHLQVTVNGPRLGLQDGDTGALVNLRTPEEALEWATFLTSSPLAQQPIVRSPRPPSTGQPRSKVSVSGLRKGPGSRGTTPATNPNQAEHVLFATNPNQADSSQAHNLQTSPPHPASTPTPNPPKPSRTETDRAQQQEKEESDIRKDQEAYAQLNAKITEIEGRIKHNAEHYASVLWDKEKVVVAECRVFRAKERKRVRAGYERLQGMFKPMLIFSMPVEGRIYRNDKS